MHECVACDAQAAAGRILVTQDICEAANARFDMQPLVTHGQPALVQASGRQVRVFTLSGSKLLGASPEDNAMHLIGREVEIWDVKYNRGPCI